MGLFSLQAGTLQYYLFAVYGILKFNFLSVFHIFLWFRVSVLQINSFVDYFFFLVMCKILA